MYAIRSYYGTSMYNARKAAYYYEIYTGLNKTLKQVNEVAAHNILASLSFSAVFNAI